MKFFLNQTKKSLLFLLTDNSLSFTFQLVCLGLIIIGCCIVRLWTIDAPALDRTHWKEIDYIAISGNYWKHGFHFFQPEINWPAEPPRVTAMELPVVPFAASLLYPTFGFNVVTVRLVSVFAYLLMSLYVFRLGKRELGPLPGLLGAFTASIMPLYHPFGRILFSEPLMIAMSVMALFHFAKWIDFHQKRDWILAMLGFSLAVSLKLTPLYLLLPLLWIAFRTYRFEIYRYKTFLTFVLCALIIPIAWYSYAYYLMNNSIDVLGIFRGHDRFQTITMLTTPYWYKLMFIRIFRDILGGPVGAFLGLLGLMASVWLREGGLFFSYLAAIGCFFVIVAEGQWDAPYRQLTIIPPLAVFVGIGALTLVLALKTIVGVLGKSFASDALTPKFSLILTMIVISVLLPYNYERIFKRDPSRPVDQRRWKLAQKIRMYAEPDAKLIAVGEYTIHKGGNDLSPVLYHYSGLQGWNLQREEWNFDRISALVQKGATLIAATKPGSPTSMLSKSELAELAPFLHKMKARYKLLYEDKEQGFLLLDLQHPLNDSSGKKQL